jgi:hypothetical protein
MTDDDQILDIRDALERLSHAISRRTGHNPLIEIHVDRETYQAVESLRPRDMIATNLSIAGRIGDPMIAGVPFRNLAPRT